MRLHKKTRDASKPCSSGKEEATQQEDALSLQGSELSSAEEDQFGNPSFSHDEHSTMPLKKKKVSGKSFQSMQLFAPVFRALQNKGYKLPTPIQRQVIPLLLDGLDVVAMARTGSGKTASFVIPMIHRLKAHSAKVGARALILAPSRELALQSLLYVKTLSKYTDLRAVALLGGDSLHEQFDGLLANPDIIVATPGRLIHIIEETKSDLLSCVQMIVLDEVDRLFELGLAEQIRQILSLAAKSSEPKTTALFSATLPATLIDFATAGLKNPRLVRIDVENQLSPDLETFFYSVKTADKEAMLLTLLLSPVSPIRIDMSKTNETSATSKRASDSNHVRGGMIFVATRHHVEYLHELLASFHVPHAYLYGNMDPSARRYALSTFRFGAVPVLVATDLAARGLDVPHLDWVLHYDFPSKEKLYVHRAGRVARAGRPGKAVAFVTSDELPYLVDLHRFLGRSLVTSGQGSSDGNTMTDVVVGSIPQSALDEYNQQLQVQMSHSSALASLKHVSLNATQLYSKTRARATSAAHEIAKQVAPSIGTHPQWRSFESSQEDLIAKLRTFRPHETVFEAMRKNAHGQKKDATVALIQRRREFVEKRQSASAKAPAASQLAPQTAAKSDAYYLAYAKPTAAVDLGLAIHHSGDPLSVASNKSALALDLFTGNDETGQLATRSRAIQVWDKKAKKFVRVPPSGESSLQAEGGASFFKPKRHAVTPGHGLGDAFTQWKKKRKLTSGLPNSGSAESADQTESLFSAQKPDYRRTNNGKKFARLGKAPIERISNMRKSTRGPRVFKGSMVKSELKRPEQVLKARRAKMKGAEKLAQRIAKKKQSTKPKHKPKKRSS